MGGQVVIYYAMAIVSSVASPIYQEGQSERNFLIFGLPFQFFLFLLFFFLIFPFSSIFGKFFIVKLPPCPVLATPQATVIGTSDSIFLPCLFSLTAVFILHDLLA